MRGSEVRSPRLLEHHKGTKLPISLAARDGITASFRTAPRPSSAWRCSASGYIGRLVELSATTARINPAVADSSPPSHCREHIASSATAPQIAAQRPNDSDNTKISALLCSARTRPGQHSREPARPAHPIALFLLPTCRETERLDGEWNPIQHS